MTTEGTDWKQRKFQVEQNKNHKELYPHQYSHELVGKRVSVPYKGKTLEGTVQRVLNTRFGYLVILNETPPGMAFSIDNVTEIKDEEKDS